MLAANLQFNACDFPTTAADTTRTVCEVKVVFAEQFAEMTGIE